METARIEARQAKYCRTFLPHPSFPATVFSSFSPALQTSWDWLKMGCSSWAQRYQFLPVFLPEVLPSELPQQSEASPGSRRPGGLPRWAQGLRRRQQPQQQLWGWREKKNIKKWIERPVDVSVPFQNVTQSVMLTCSYLLLLLLLLL